MFNQHLCHYNPRKSSLNASKHATIQCRTKQRVHSYHTGSIHVDSDIITESGQSFCLLVVYLGLLYKSNLILLLSVKLKLFEVKRVITGICRRGGRFQ